MPKLRQTTEQTRKMQGVIAKCLKETGIEKRHLAIKLHLSLTSLYARLNEPERFTVGELKKMAEVLKFSDMYYRHTKFCIFPAWALMD